MDDHSLLQDLSKTVISSAKQKKPIQIEGAGSKRFLGGETQGQVVSLKKFAGMLEYEPSELVFTAKAGTSLQEIERILTKHGQMLAFEPPLFNQSGTIGGAVASGLAGPRRQTHGGVRDFILGCTIMNSQGQILHFGGTVMKNVAGFDVSRLMAGSMGCLGIILDVSIKVLPIPEADMTLHFEHNANDFIERVNTWLGQPTPISASAWHDGSTWVRLSGNAVAIKEVADRLGGDVVSNTLASHFWQSIRNQEHDFFRRRGELYRLSLPACTPIFPWQENVFIEWAGAQRWINTPTQVQPEDMQSRATELKGHATVYRSQTTDFRRFSFTPPTKPLLEIHKRLKQAFDPEGIFNPGRMSPIL